MDAHRSWLGGVEPLSLRQPYRALGPQFFREQPPEGLPDPVLRLVSEDAAQLLGLDPPDETAAPDWAAVFSGNRVDPACPPIATVYAGHQFGNWAGRLGDGRAHLLGAAAAPDASRNRGYAAWEVQLKGAGRTPFSRFGDGRAVLRSSMREFLCSEAMWHLGVPTTRALCLVGSTLPVMRERPETAAVVTRLAPTFVRFGHFEHFSHGGDHAALRRLVDWCLPLLLPDADADAAAAPDDVAALRLLTEVVDRTARLVAQWQAMGFIHGVLNTDNMSILGWTLDYGPFAFMDAFDPAHTPNTTDHFGRYAWARQPAVARWNLLALAQALLPLIQDPQRARDAVEAFGPSFAAAVRAAWQRKLGLDTFEPGDDTLADDWLRLLAAHRADWTLSWRLLADVARDPFAPAPPRLAAQFASDPAALAAWIARYAARTGAAGGTGDARRAAMHQANPRYVLRHHLAQDAIQAAESGDFGPARTLLTVLRTPYAEQPAYAAFAEPPPDDAPPAALSCSS